MDTNIREFEMIRESIANIIRGYSYPVLRTGQALYRRYGRFFAEFLKDESLVPLGLLALSTCVGFRYGFRLLNSPELFSEDSSPALAR